MYFFTSIYVPLSYINTQNNKYELQKQYILIKLYNIFQCK